MKNRNVSYIAVLFLAVVVLLAACGDAPVEDMTEKKWGTAELIETGSGSARYPQVLFDSVGNAMAVWRQQSDGTRGNIWANRYVTGTGWGTAGLIGTGSGGVPGDVSPQVAMDSDGNALAVWREYDGTTDDVWANRYVAGVGWGTAELIETSSGYTWDPQVAFDPGGNALALWWQSAGPASGIWANRYVAGTGWGTAEPTYTDNSGGAYGLQLAFDSGGNAMAIWYQLDDARTSIQANRYVAGTGWGTAELIDVGSGEACVPKVAFDSGGNAMAVWQDLRSEGFNTLSIWANRYLAGAGWGTAELIDTGLGFGNGGTPQVAFDSDASAMVVWSKWHGTAEVSIWANRYGGALAGAQRSL